MVEIAYFVLFAYPLKYSISLGAATMISYTNDPELLYHHCTNWLKNYLVDIIFDNVGNFHSVLVFHTKFTLKSETMSKFHLLRIAKTAITYYKQKTLDLVNGYIKKQERKLKLRPANFIHYIVVTYYQGKEKFTSNERGLLFQNGKRSVKILDLWSKGFIRLPLKYKWNVKNPINVEWRLFGFSEDFYAQCEVGCDIIGYKTGYKTGLRCPAFYIWTTKEYSFGDQIRLRIEIRSDRVIVKLDRQQSNDDLITSCGNWKQYEYVNHRLGEMSSDEDLFVIPIIDITTGKKKKDGKGSEIHLITHSVTCVS